MIRNFPIVDVSAWEVVNVEPIGRDRKLWLREPGAPKDSLSRERDWLYKPVVIPQHGHRQGEDWAEKIVSELGRLLGVPCAEVRLAVHDGEEGAISRNVISDGWSRVLGSELRGTVVPNYQEGRLNPRGRPKSEIPTLVATAHQALDLVGERDRRYWTGRLRDIEQDEIEDVVRSIPRLSEPTAKFIIGVLDIHRRRLLHDD
ncbi:hypothetical protein [Pseudonocardia asaccharolytica]|uniref:HipA-like C-terminal domain-containing protein n=1 Tax=Pseudonocardia asaccharolytica DSM 44247 = NBRC 16224 TaxID=1123024 RepID=A0A511D181_9PSEU|nr:hypothetical protein [Pseudonocardia asaccharolytica]GEL17294.1 hypothetical protein PA7_11310 [Pseudonocardia asaccharolytica DSM 44247 = NBRC 16224]